VAQVGQQSVRARVRTLNNRGLRMNFHFPEEFSWRAPEMKKMLKKYFRRGTVDIWLHIVSDSAGGDVTIDEEVAKAYAEKLEELQSKLRLSGTIDMNTVVNLPGVVRGVELSATDEVWEAGAAAVIEASEMAVSMRETEGATLAEELLGICSRAEKLVDEAEGRAPAVVDGYREKLLARLGSMTEGEELPFSEQDIVREIAMFADRADITEELCRLRSHSSAFRQAVESDGPVGRRLEFIGQEMLREANTLSAKSNDSVLSGISVDLRAEIERIKEQAGNVE